jgi:hypothetical protein
MDKVITVQQPSDIYDLLDIRNRDEADKVLAAAYSYLVYLKVGDSLQTSRLTFNKISSDIIQIEVNLDPNILIDELEAKRIIKIPV